MKLTRCAMLGITFGLLAGCDNFTDPDVLAEFSYTESSHGTAIEDHVEIVELGREVFLQGELNTPTPCYTLEADSKESGKNLTLTVTGRKRDVVCAQQILGGYRYQAVFRFNDTGTYNLKVINSFLPAERASKEFTFTVNVR